MRFLFVILFILAFISAFIPATGAYAQYVPHQQEQEPSATPDAEGTGQLCLSLKPQQTYINIEVVIPEPTYDHSKDMRALTREIGAEHRQDWLKKNGLDELWTSSELTNPGYASTGWEVDPQFFVKATPVDRFGAWYCPHILEVNIAVLMKTTINIAKEFLPGTCHYEAVEAHEYKHFLVNKYVVEQAMAKMKSDLPAIIRDMEMQGYVGRGMVEERVELIKESISDMFKVYMKEQISKEMKELNAQVDTPEEYDRVSKLKAICDYKLKMQKSQKNAARKQGGFSGKVQEMGQK